MNRISQYAKIVGRTLTRTPLPDQAYRTMFGKVRVPMPPSGVTKKHAVDMELVNRTRVVWLDRHKAGAGVIVYLHGGGYTGGPYVGDWEWLSEQADARECAGLLIDYRYGPDHVHPTALDDSVAALEGLAERGDVTSGQWVLVGHQSGAGLALALVSRLKKRVQDEPGSGLSLPAGLVLMNPWLDLELSNVEAAATENRDPVHERKLLQLSVQAYAGRTKLDDPELSPINGSLDALAPIHMSVGTKDLFLTDTRVSRPQFERHGTALTYREIPGRLSVTPRLRRGADIQRLTREQAVFIERALG